MIHILKKNLIGINTQEVFLSDGFCLAIQGDEQSPSKIATPSVERFWGDSFLSQIVLRQKARVKETEICSECNLGRSFCD